MEGWNPWSEWSPWIGWDGRFFERNIFRFMIKKLSILAIQCGLFVAMMMGGTQATAQQDDKVKNEGEAQKVGIVAHRGFHKYDGSAENTISSMQNAVDHDFYGTEFDMQITGDDMAIIFHDNELKGLPIGEAPLTEVLEHPASTLNNGEKIPTLKEFMESCAKALEQQSARGTTTRLFFEIKTPKNDDKVDLAAAMAMESVRQWGLENNVCFISFSLPVCKTIANTMPGIAVGYLGGDVPPHELKEMGINTIDYNYKVLLEHPEWIKEAKKLGMKVIVWTVNDAETAHQMKKMGVDYITTDLPLDMTEWMEEN